MNRQELKIVYKNMIFLLSVSVSVSSQCAGSEVKPQLRTEVVIVYCLVRAIAHLMGR
jgi:hypothetical protein